MYDMLTAVTGAGYTRMNGADLTPALEELIIDREGLQNTALGQTQAKNGFYIFKGLFKRQMKEYVTENVHRHRSL